MSRYIVIQTKPVQMKKLPFLLLPFLFFACYENKPTNTEPKESVAKDTVLSYVGDNNATLQKWVSYYQTIDPSFAVDKFKFSTSTNTEYVAGNIYGIFDKKFDKVYTDFLIYSPNKQQYIDMDSYQWTVDKNELLFEADQEINLVDIPQKTVKRIGFRGASGWVDDAYWKNDSIVVLLENTADKVPVINEINVKTGNELTFVYSDTLKQNSDYSKKRIEETLKIKPH